MSIAKENKKLLTQFLEEVWNAGDIEASDKYVAQKYTRFTTIMVIRGKDKNLILLDTKNA